MRKLLLSLGGVALVLAMFGALWGTALGQGYGIVAYAILEPTDEDSTASGTFELFQTDPDTLYYNVAVQGLAPNTHFMVIIDSGFCDGSAVGMVVTGPFGNGINRAIDEAPIELEELLMTVAICDGDHAVLSGTLVAPRGR